MRDCKNIKVEPEGFDGKIARCAVCGYGEFIEGRYYRWKEKPEPAEQPPCAMILS